MLRPNSTDLGSVGNLENAIKSQIEKLEKLREQVRSLEFEPIEPMGAYAAVSYKAVDGGRMRISFDPLELNMIDVADSYGNLKMRFIVPRDSDESEFDPDDYLDENPIIKDFVALLGKKSITEISEIIGHSDSYMEIAEWACIFHKIVHSDEDPVILMRDGLLRTKKLKSELLPRLLDKLREKKRTIRLVGVSKTSAVMTLLSTAISIEKKIPYGQIGFVKIPLGLELQAYTWSGKGKIRDKGGKESNGKRGIYYSLGDLYIVKLSKKSNLLVTVEIPRDRVKGLDIYSDSEVRELMSHLAKDSAYSYPVLGYPQTIMRAHEYAVSTGFPASVVRDRILDKIREHLDDKGKDYMRDAEMMKEEVSKGVLGGGSS